MPDVRKVIETQAATNGYVNCLQVYFEVDGRPRNYLILELPGGGESVLMVVRRSDGRIACVWNMRASDDLKQHLVLPGGLKNVKPGGEAEALPVAAQRELREELGVTASTMIEIGIVDVHPLVRDKVHVFLIDNVFTTVRPTDSETLGVEWLHDLEIEERITDGQSLAALAKLHVWDRGNSPFRK